LNDGPIELRRAAALALAALGLEARAAVSALSTAVSASDPELRTAAVQSLGAIGPEARKAVPGLAEALKDGDVRFQVTVLRVLGKLGPDAAEALAAIQTCLQSGEREVRREAVAALGAMGPTAEPAARVLVELLASNDTHQATVDALVKIGKAAVPALLQAIDRTTFNKDPHVRHGAVVALGRLGLDAAEAVDEVRSMAFKDAAPENRAAAADALRLIQKKP
jgi:HEAT repeat protein